MDGNLWYKEHMERLKNKKTVALKPGQHASILPLMHDKGLMRSKTHDTGTIRPLFSGPRRTFQRPPLDTRFRMNEKRDIPSLFEGLSRNLDGLDIPPQFGPRSEGYQTRPRSGNRYFQPSQKPMAKYPSQKPAFNLNATNVKKPSKTVIPNKEAKPIEPLMKNFPQKSGGIPNKRPIAKPEEVIGPPAKKPSSPYKEAKEIPKPSEVGGPSTSKPTCPDNKTQHIPMQKDDKMANKNAISSKPISSISTALEKRNAEKLVRPGKNVEKISTAVVKTVYPTKNNVCSADEKTSPPTDSGALAKPTILIKKESDENGANLYSDFSRVTEKRDGANKKEVNQSAAYLEHLAKLKGTCKPVKKQFPVSGELKSKIVGDQPAKLPQTKGDVTKPSSTPEKSKSSLQCKSNQTKVKTTVTPEANKVKPPTKTSDKIPKKETLNLSNVTSPNNQIFCGIKKEPETPSAIGTNTSAKPQKVDAKPKDLDDSNAKTPAIVGSNTSKPDNINNAAVEKSPDLFPNDEFVTLDSTYGDDEVASEEKPKSRPKSSDFFSSPPLVIKQEKITPKKPVLKGILKRPSAQKIKSPTEPKSQRHEPNSETRLKPNLGNYEPDALEVVPSLERTGQDKLSNLHLDSALAAGLDYIHPVSGYHCLLCRTFYHDYPTALHHCTLLTHKMKIITENDPSKSKSAHKQSKSNFY